MTITSMEFDHPDERSPEEDFNILGGSHLQRQVTVRNSN